MYIICTNKTIIVQNVYNVKCMIQIGKKLKELRLGEGLTQAELAAKLNIGRVNYTRYELDKVRPDYETLLAIADFYGVTTDEILR